MKRRFLRQLEQFEERLCLTVTAALSGDDLVIGGTADGAVEILATGAGSYQVSDNGVVINTITGATDDIRISLAGESAAGGNQVTLDLGDQTVDSIMASLGNGENIFTVQNGTANTLRYIGGSGNDSVTLATDFTLAGTSNGFCGSTNGGISLGSGDNNLSVESEIVGSLAVQAGSGADKVDIGVDASIGRALNVTLGGGDDLFTFAGEAASASINLGDGNNSLSVTGSLTGGLNYQGGSGNDTVDIPLGALIGGSVKLSLGAGDNTVDLGGAVGGDFVVRSANSADVVTIADTAVISGTSDVQPGVETLAKAGRHGGGSLIGGPRFAGLRR